MRIHTSRSPKLPGSARAAARAVLVLVLTAVAFTPPALAQEALPAPDDVAAAPADAVEIRKGLKYKVLEEGTGEKSPKARSTVKVHYSGWTTDGKMFDSSVVRGEPAVFRLDQVIRGWTLGLQEMVEGQKVRLWIPESMAYGGRPGSPQGMLVFDVELIEIVRR